MKVPVKTLDGSGSGASGGKGSDIELTDEIFAVEPRADIHHRVVTWQLEKRRGAARGARVRDFNPSLNKKVRALGLKMALSSKAANGQLIVLDNLDVAEGKTRILREKLGGLGFGKTALVIDGEALNVGFARASSNLGSINLLPAIS